jgi:ABC-type nickel/cobalt efflux system permease component RcnA
MGDGHVWVLAGSLSSLFDVSNYGVKEWLQLIAAVVGIFISIIGAWRTYRYSKSQIAKRLSEHLHDEEKEIKEGRNAVIRHIRYGRPLTKEPDHAFYETLKDVLGQIDHGESHLTERRLSSFAESLVGDAKVGEKYVSNINLQAATVYILLGKLAKDRDETTPARTAWTSALQHHDRDAEAARYLGELALAAGEAEQAWEHFATCLSP